MVVTDLLRISKETSGRSSPPSKGFLDKKTSDPMQNMPKSFFNNTVIGLKRKQNSAVLISSMSQPRDTC